MAPSARVTSLEALETFKAALCEFATGARNALAGVETELARVTDWLEQQTAHWRREIQKREESLIRAKGELTLRRYSAGSGTKRDCTEQELAVARAQAALKHAQQKQEACRRWAVRLPRDMEDCRGPAWLLGGMLDSDVRQAIAFLGQKVTALEGYVAVKAGPGPAAAPAPPTNDS